MSNIANLDTSALDTAAKFFRTMQKAGADFTGPMQDIPKRCNLAEYLKFDCPKVNSDGIVDAIPEPYDLARYILGNDVISPEETMVSWGISYTDVQLGRLKEVFPPTEIIAWSRINNMMLLPTPPEEMSLHDILKLKCELFDRSDADYFGRASIAKRDNTGATGWLVLRKGIMQRSTSLKWKRQLQLLSHIERVPNIAELAWGLITYKQARGSFLLEKGIHARTSSTSGGQSFMDGFPLECMSVGVSSKGKFEINSWGCYNSDRYGVSSALKL